MIIDVEWRDPWIERGDIPKQCDVSEKLTESFDDGAAHADKWQGRRRGTLRKYSLTQICWR